jgi:hypothetical protein
MVAAGTSKAWGEVTMNYEQDVSAAIAIIERHLDHWYQWEGGRFIVWGDEGGVPQAIINTFPLECPEQCREHRFMVAWLDDGQPTSTYYPWVSTAYQAVVDRFAREVHAPNN